MKIFSYLYDKTLQWSGHQHAPYYLAGVSFAESSFFPIPPDVMLISMGLAKPEKSWRFAFITTLFSVLGGIFGYMLGLFGMELVDPWLQQSAYQANYLQIVQWFKEYGIWIVFIAGFSPIPYKLFTIAAGVMQMPFLPFVVASALGRGMRFFLVSGIMYYKGEGLKAKLRLYVDVIGWSLLGLIIIGFILVKWWV